MTERRYMLLAINISSHFKDHKLKNHQYSLSVNKLSSSAFIVHQNNHITLSLYHYSKYPFTLPLSVHTSTSSSRLSPFPASLWQLLPSFRLSSLRCRITIMVSCDDDVLSSGMEMQHATAHIIRAECIRCHL